MNINEIITNGEAALGIEFGSTRIKAVLTAPDSSPIASGSHDWENRYENGVWTYSEDDIVTGLQDCYAKLKADVADKYGVKLTKLKAMGISAMMHGYIALDKDDNFLVPFRTWRNSITGQAAEELTALFDFNIPQRWSIAHLYQAILNGEEHLPNIAFQTTLAGYIHYRLTGEKVLGVGEASGMFPIDVETKDFDAKMEKLFDEKIADKGFSWKMRDIFPKVLVAGDNAGTLTEDGAKFIDPSGDLEAGILLCPPEGDAGTGMVATNSVAVRTGNVSAGTSVFAMVVLEKPLNKVYPEIDVVTTPTGSAVGMVHCNNCTSDINAWVNLLKGFTVQLGLDVSMPQLYDALYFAAAKGAPDCGGLLSYNYFSGENITGFDEGRPLFVRTPKSDFSFENFARTHIYSALGTLKIGLDIMLKDEGVKLDKMLGHGGLFKTPEVGQRIMADAIDVPVSVMSTAGEGGAWGIALLAAYAADKNGETLEEYLDKNVFAANPPTSLDPVKEEAEGFNVFIERYKKGLPIEKAAVETMEL